MLKLNDAKNFVGYFFTAFYIDNFSRDPTSTFLESKKVTIPSLIKK